MSTVDQYSVETPESVEVSFELAGPGSRFCALAIDLTLLWLAVFVLFVVLMCAGAPLWSQMDDMSDDAAFSWFLAILIVLAMVVMFGYHVIFEFLMNGQTPGKRYIQIRVIRDDGTPATGMDIVIRNLVRLVDVLPGAYVVGGIAAFLHPQYKRLGDMAAGTIVVREGEIDYHASADAKRKAAPLAEASVTYGALSAEEQRLVRGFLQRRDELLADARERLAQGLAQRLSAKHGGDISDPESYLERLAEGHHIDT